jgi:UDP-2,3-diacylglucosamine pyrophosphatase LpxH
VKGVPQRQGAAVERLLEIFFGYPSRAVWRSLATQTAPDFWIANPVYAQAVNGRAYLFAHGTHFRGDVELPTWLKKLADALEIDALAGLELSPGRDSKAARTLAELEEFIAPFVETLWPSAGNDPVPESDKLWYLLTRISGKFGSKRPTPTDSRCFAARELPTARADRIHRLTEASRPSDHSVTRAQSHFLPLVNAAADEAHLPAARTFVYGDTHRGGFGDLQEPPMRLYNTGSWVVHNEADHPPCHLFAVDQNGEEYLMDISFKDIPVEGGQLLEVAARDAEHKKSRVNRVVRSLIDLAIPKSGTGNP